MKKNLLMVMLVILGISAKAQYNNEWIDYNKTYYKFKVGATGLYRISTSMLQQAGLANTPLDQFQVFRNGQQVPLYTTTTGVPGSNDYIEFYGEMNDGRLDTRLYRQASLHMDNTFSLLTDTAAFFLTVNPAGGNLRVQDQANNVAGNTLPVEQYFMHTLVRSFRDNINPGFAAVLSGVYVYSSSYDAGEGWASRDIAPSTPINETQQLFPFTSGPNAVLSVGASGNAPNQRTMRVSINGTQVMNETLNFFAAGTRQASIPISLLGRPGGDQFTIANTSANGSDRMVVSNYKLAYPRQFNFGGSKRFEFQLDPNPAGNYLEIANFNNGSTAPILYDITNRRRYIGNISGGLVRFALAGSSQPRRLVLMNVEASEILPVTGFQVRNFVNFGQAANQGNYLIITHSKLTNGPSGNPIENYRLYRTSAAGGSYNAKVYDIDQLVDQFAFGIKYHPLSIKNFINYSRNVFSARPQYVMIFGRGVLYNEFRLNESRRITYDIGLVPTFGWPGSDNLLASPNYDPLPDISIGRLAAVNGEEIENYLAKVREYEAFPQTAPNTVKDRAWMKNMVHAIGGSDPFLQSIIYGYMNMNKAVLEDTLKGGKVYTFSKNSALAVEQLNAEQLAGLFEEGIGLLTYFGHSSTNTLEFNIDDPDRYNNKGKYPLFIVNGCNAGNIFAYDTLRVQSQSFTLSERYMMAKERGSIGFLASTHYGVVNYLNTYTNSFYRSYSATNYGKTLGQVQVGALDIMIRNTSLADYYTRLHAEQINIHGDPAVKLYAADQPDYVIEDPMVRINPIPVSVADATFNLFVKFQNVGKAVEDTFRIRVQRQLPSGALVDIFNARRKATRFADSLSFDVPVNPLSDKGENRIIVTIDSENRIVERSEANNTVSKQFIIIEDELRPIAPYNYAIVNTATPTFFASVANPFAKPRNYVIEVDTTELFNSSFRKTATVNSGGGLIQFNVPSLTLSDSTVYYWRTAPVPNQGADFTWNTSSFVYLSNSTPGYNMSHYFQMKRNSYNKIDLGADRTLRYTTRTRKLGIKTGLFPSFVNDKLLVTLDERQVVSYGCRYSSLQIVVYDKVTFDPWTNSLQGNGLGRFGSWPPCIHNGNAFEFPYGDPAFRKRAMDFLESIPSGYYVSITNLGTASNTSFIQEWMADTASLGSGRSLYHTLKQLGFVSIDSFTRNLPFIFMARIGGNFPAYQAMGRSASDYLEMNTDMVASENEGTIESPWFGPALGWNRIAWRGRDLRVPPTDATSIEIYGRTFNGPEVMLARISPAVDSSLSWIDAKRYPFLRLKMLNKDSAEGTPNQLRYWRLFGTLPPEGAIAPNVLLRIKDSVVVGEPLSVELAFRNVSQSAFDSVRVQARITDASNVTRDLRVPKQKPIVAGDTLVLRYQVDTRGLVGQNTLFLNFNPDYDQPEQYLFNNFLFKSFNVINDTYHPTLDVTFDGVRILNQDIVSAKPHVMIKLTDENRFMLLDDTSLMKVRVKFPDNQVREYRFDNDTLKFTPASAGASQNTAQIDFYPKFSQDGFYELIVTGSDKSGNRTGIIEYKVVFSIVNKPMISNLLNYPNPFTTSTAFVFTVTGSEVPQNIRIQILTITGKVVREITREELGPIHIGRNITEFKWDGTDQYGQRLANGVYLYRVITNLNGKSLDKLRLEGINGDRYNDGSTDKFFRNGYGKMYLMR